MTLTLTETFDTNPDWNPNRWGGWDYRTTNPNLRSVGVRISRDDGAWSVFRFTTDRYSILEWEARIDFAAPPSVLRSTVDAALAQ